MAAILDDRKSLSKAFLAISDQYTTFCFEFFSKWPPAAILEVWFVPKTIGFFHYVLSMAMPNMKLIGEFMTQLETPQAFWAFLYKSLGSGNLDLNGYDEYDFDRWQSYGLCKRWRASAETAETAPQPKNIISLKFFKFRGYNNTDTIRRSHVNITISREFITR